MTCWTVRTWFLEDGAPVFDDDGPFDRYLAELILADIGRDASISRGMGRVTVERAMLVHDHDCYAVAEEQPASSRTDL